jgi:hypothetical protein
MTPVVVFDENTPVLSQLLLLRLVSVFLVVIYIWLFVNWAAKFIDEQQNYLFGQQKIYFFGQPFS